MVKLFSHCDLDGFGCSLVAQYYLGSENLDVEYCVYGNQKNSLDYRLTKFMENKEYEKYDLVLITDVSPSDEVAEKIQETMHNKVLLLDHHDSAKHLMNLYSWAYVYSEANTSSESDVKQIMNLYSWASVNTEANTRFATSATWMVSKFFQNQDGVSIIDKTRRSDKFVASNPFLDFIVEKIRRYDTWEWKTKYNDEKAGELNMLFYLYGGKEFVKEFLSRCDSELFSPSDDGMFNENEKFFIKWDKEKTNRIIGSTATSKIYKMDFFGKRAAVAFSDTFVSELGNTICEKHQDVDIAVIISLSLKTISFRSTKNEINLGKFAKMFGGGGHPQAAGCQFEGNVATDIIHVIMTDMLWKKYQIQTTI
jgi:uncharacterized protein